MLYDWDAYRLYAIQGAALGWIIDICIGRCSFCNIQTFDSSPSPVGSAPRPKLCPMQMLILQLRACTLDGIWF